MEPERMKEIAVLLSNFDFPLGYTEHDILDDIIGELRDFSDSFYIEEMRKISEELS
jgi:hypothetical protein